MTDDGRMPPHAQAAAPQAVDAVYIMEPTLPAHLTASAPARDPDWSAMALEELAKQLSETNGFYRPLLDAAQELRDLRSVNAGLIEQSRAAQWRPCRLQAEPLREVADWLERYRQFWDESFRRLDEYLVELQHTEKDHDYQQ